MEHTWLATAYRTVRKFCSSDQVSAFVTDACLCNPSRLQKPKLESSALAHKHGDGTNVFRVQDADPRFIISSGLPVTQDTVHANVTSISDDEQPAFQGWRDFYETDDELAFDEALRLVEQGQSVFLQGFGGTGRTFAAKEIARKCKALTCAYTHCAAQNISVEGCPGGTLHHCLHKYPAWSGVVIIDEVSQIPLALWAVIQKWLFPALRSYYWAIFAASLELPTIAGDRRRLTPTLRTRSFFDASAASIA